MPEAEPLPQIRDELERKVLDEIVRLTTNLEAGRLEQGQYALITRSLWTVVSGLIPDDSLQMVADAANSAPTPKSRAIFFNKGDLYVFAWHPDRDGASCLRMGQSFPAPKLTQIDILTPDVRHARLTAMFASLKKAGWTQVL